jgi:hypothetical protein
MRKTTFIVVIAAIITVLPQPLVGWVRTYGGDLHEHGNCIQNASDGGYILCGFTDSFGTTEPPGSSSSVWLLKINPEGDTLWTSFYGENWVTAGFSITITPDNGYIMTGLIWDWEGVNTGLKDIWIMKVDSLGNDVPTVSEKPIDTETNWQLLSSIGHSIVLQYNNLPQSFHATIFDASGRKVDELHSTEQSGIVTWGEEYSPGVYFIRVESDTSGSAHKVVLMK